MYDARVSDSRTMDYEAIYAKLREGQTSVYGWGARISWIVHVRSKGAEIEFLSFTYGSETNEVFREGFDRVCEARDTVEV